jgi:lysophospholipase L1-like esterase
MNMKRSLLLGSLVAGTVCAQVQDQGGRFVVQPETVEPRGNGAVLIRYNLTDVPLETSLNSTIYYEGAAAGNGSNPSFAVWAVDEQGGKVEQIGQVTINPNNRGAVQFPVSGYVRDHLRDGSVSFLIEKRGAPGFSQEVEFSGQPTLAIIKAQTPDYVLADLLRPVWQGREIVNETLLPTSCDGASAEANLAFIPSRVVSVKNYALTKTYVEGEDYIMDGRTLRLTENSSIPFFGYGELYHHDPNAKPGAMRTLDGGYLTFSETAYFNDKQLAVTYEHDDAWDGPIPASAGKFLPRTFQTLKKGRTLKLVVFGDSISFGASASGTCIRAPWMPRWGDLVAEELHRAYGAEIDYINPSLGGMVSSWGRDTVDGLVSFEKPDLVIIGFGMNDAGGGVSAEQFVANTRSMMASVRKKNPAAEFILLMSFQPNPQWRTPDLMQNYLEAFKSMEGKGVAVADVWSVHGYLLKHKTYWDMTGNHVNHPNDFMTRIYAQTLLATLGVGPDSGKLSGKPGK